MKSRFTFVLTLSLVAGYTLSNGDTVNRRESRVFLLHPFFFVEFHVAIAGSHGQTNCRQGKFNAADVNEQTGISHNHRDAQFDDNKRTAFFVFSL